MVVAIQESLKFESLNPALTELERIANFAWNRTYVSQRDVKYSGPPIVVTVQSKGKKANCLGWFWANRWSTREGTECHEISISAEFLGRSAEEIAETVIHEVVHLWNHIEGIKDCSDSGRHNKKFKEAAISMGLRVFDPWDSRGFAYTEMNNELVEAVREDLKPDVAAFNVFRLTPSKTSKSRKTKAYICNCEQATVRVSEGVELDATCNTCDVNYRLKS